jgi:uncharacterized membrane protein YjjB (DUF3815 family)
MSQAGWLLALPSNSRGTCLVDDPDEFANDYRGFGIAGSMNPPNLISRGAYDLRLSLNADNPCLFQWTVGSAGSDDFDWGSGGEDVAGELRFRGLLKEYFDARGMLQKQLRAQIAQSLSNARNLRGEIRSILAYVAEPSPQENIIAAIDLLAQLGHKIVLITVEAAFSPTVASENAAFVMAMAAGKISTPIAWSILPSSPHEVFREAAVMLLSSLPPEEARPALRHIASGDQSSSIRSLAEESLQALS